MTGVCGGATSSSKPGFGLSLYVTSGGLGGLLNNIATKWAIFYGALLAGTTFTLSTLCSTDPPADPGITAADAQHLLTLDDPAAAAAAAGKFYQLAARTLWYQVCQCDDGSTPTALPVIPAPVGLPVINPPVAAPLPALDCGHIVYQQQAQGAFEFPVYPGSGSNVIGSSTSLPTNGPVTAVISVTRNNIPGPNSAWTFTWHWLSSTGAVVRTDAFPDPGPGATTTKTYTQPFNATVLSITAHAADGADLKFFTVDVQFFCGGVAPTNPSTPCCPPDPILSLRLDQIMNIVTLMQRQSVPFAYVPGAVHAGLSGHGDISVSGLIGCKVNITTLPSTLGQSWTNPIEIFDAGFITWNTPDGYPSSLRVDHNPYLSLPARCGAYTDVAYDFHPGVVATITELKREP